MKKDWIDVATTASIVFVVALLVALLAFAGVVVWRQYAADMAACQAAGYEPSECRALLRGEGRR